MSIAEITRALVKFVPGWGALEPSQISVQKLTGGMSNVIYSAEALDFHAPVTKVVARLLSSTLDGVIDRNRENAIVKFVSTTGIGPQLLGTCTLLAASAPLAPPIMLRIEEFVYGRTLGIADLRHSLRIARIMALKIGRLHAQTMRLAQQLAEVSAAPVGGSDQLPPPGFAEACVKFRGLLCAVETQLLGFSGGVSVKAELLGLLRLFELEPECIWLISLLRNHGGPTVLIHGDLQEGNWIEQQDTHDLLLLDYEYSRFDYRAADTGNLFCEHAFDYSVADPPGYSFTPSEYPSIAWQREFFSAYTAEAQPQPADSATVRAAYVESCGIPAAVDAGATAATCYADRDEGWRRTTVHAGFLAETFPAPIVALVAEARVGMLASHFYWMLWGIVMGAGKAGVTTSQSSSPLSPSVASGHSVFDYLHYARMRASEYTRMKAQLLADTIE